MSCRLWLREVRQSETHRTQHHQVGKMDVAGVRAVVNGVRAVLGGPVFGMIDQRIGDLFQGVRIERMGIHLLHWVMLSAVVAMHLLLMCICTFLPLLFHFLFPASVGLFFLQSEYDGTPPLS